MPAKSPVTQEIVNAKLSALGACIRAQRKALRVSANAAAQAAGVSRVTLHRVEHGAPSVTVGAYLNIIGALGLDLNLCAQQPQTPCSVQVQVKDDLLERMPLTLRLADYTQLQQLAWHMPGATELTPAEALGVYERNWRHVDWALMDATETALLKALVSTVGKGHLLV